MLTSLLVSAVAAASLLGALKPADISPGAEIVLVSLVQGVNPHVALAVAQAETGNVRETGGLRDRVVSQGNYGRFQVNCHAWRRPMGLDGCQDLLDRHRNIRAGISVLAYVQSRQSRRLEGPADWVAHYNEGVLVSATGERYARRVNFLMRRHRQRAEERFGALKGW